MAARGEQIAAMARACVGTPFRPQGRMPGRGLDCVGLIVHVGRSLGLTAYDESGYGMAGNGERLPRGLEAGGFIRVERAEVGDVLLFRLEKGQAHVGIKSERGVIHAHMGLGRVVEHRLDAAWQAAIVAAYRFPSRD